MPVPGCIKSSLVWAIGEAERLKGSPPYSPEVQAVWGMSYTRWVARGYLSCLLSNCYREDLYYADREFTVWSLKGPDGTEARKDLKKFSERF